MMMLVRMDVETKLDHRSQFFKIFFGIKLLDKEYQ